MITCYAGSEVTGGPPAEHQLLEPITFIRHDRDISFNRSVVVDALAAIKAEGNPQPGAMKPAGTYCHYCPYQRIFNAIQDYCMGRTRGDVLIWLFGRAPLNWLKVQQPGQGGQALAVADKSCVLSKLGIRPTKEVELVLNAAGDPLQCVLGFDIWFEWAIYSVCDWPQNMFFGKGQGDGNGTLVDEPAASNPAAELQTARVKAAFTRLLDAIPGLSPDTGKVSVDKYTKIYTKAGQNQLGDLAHMNAVDIAATLKITTALENTQNDDIYSASKKRRFAEISERFTPAQIEDGTASD